MMLPDSIGGGMKATVLLVEDEQSIVTLVKYNLEKEGFEVITTDDGEEAIILAKENNPDVIILDWMIHSITGIEVCRRIRHDKDLKNVPIIMLSARGEEDDRIQGLDVGADDYIVKPFSPSELIARIHAIFRRMRPAFSQESLKFENIHMDLAAHKVTRDGKILKMGPTEFRMLRHFMEAPSRVFSREQLLEAICGRDTLVELRTVDVHIRRLRKALNHDGKQVDVIRTVRSAGYALEMPDEI